MFLGTVHHGGDGVGTGAGDSTHTHPGNGETRMLKVCSLPHFCIQSGILGSWMVLPTIKVGLPSVVKPFWKCTHSYSKKCFYGDSKANQVGSED